MALTPRVCHVPLALHKCAGVEAVTLKAVLLKDSKPQLHPLLGKHRSLPVDGLVLVDEADGQLDVLSLLPAAGELQCPGRVPEQGVGGSHDDVCRGPCGSY